MDCTKQWIVYWQIEIINQICYTERHINRIGLCAFLFI